jgi:hypothetical protein
LIGAKASLKALSNYDPYNIDSPQHYTTMQLNCCYGQQVTFQFGIESLQYFYVPLRLFGAILKNNPNTLLPDHQQ